MEELSTWQIMGEIWDCFSGGEKALLIGTAVISLLGVLASAEEARPNNPEDIPTYSQIRQSQDRVKQLEAGLKDLESGTHSGDGATRWEEQTRQALQTIEQYRHLLFAPGKVTEIRQALADAEDFRREDRPQAAATALYQAWQLARLTEQQVLQEEVAWEKAAVDYLTCYGQLQMVLDTAPNMAVEFTTDRGKEVLSMDADFWSEGNVEKIRKRMPKEELPRDLTVAKVQEQTGTLRELAQALQDAVSGALEAFRASQQRMQLCKAVCGSFLDRGWRMDKEGENGFERKDPRKNAKLQLLSPSRDGLEFTFSGAGQMAVKPSFRGVHNRDFKTYLEQLLGQILREKGFADVRLSSL